MSNADTVHSQSTQSPSWTKPQRKILAVLKLPESRTMTHFQICQAAGYKSEGMWGEAMRGERFAAEARILHPEKQKSSVKRIVTVVEPIHLERQNRCDDEPGWTRDQQRILAVLKHPASKTMTVLQICQAAGYRSRGMWYVAIRDERFVAVVRILHPEQWKPGVNESKWTKAQQRLLTVLELPESQAMTRLEICQAAGYKRADVWLRAMRDERFAAEARVLHPERRKPTDDEHGWSKAEQRILAVLEQPESLTMTCLQVCQAAGYKSLCMWYVAMHNKRFAMVVRTFHPEKCRRSDEKTGWSKAQQRILTVLKLPESQTMTRLQICQAAGYKNVATWWLAMRDEQFAAVVFTLQPKRHKHMSSQIGVTMAHEPNHE